MKKAKILVALGALVAVAAGAFASKANLPQTFYKSTGTVTNACNFKTSVALTTTDHTIAPTFGKARLSIAPTLLPCPTITVVTVD